MISFVSNCRVLIASAPAAAAQTDVASSAIDTQGMDSLLGIAHLGDVDNTCELGLAWSSCDTSDGEFAAIDGTEVTATATSADSKVLLCELTRPTRRYVKLTLSRGTADAVLNSMVVVASMAGTLPTTASADTVGTSVATLDG